MRISYDKEADAIYISFVETTVTTEHREKGVSLDCSSDGKLAGIEILNAKENLGSIDTLKNILLENIGLSSAA
ncbi:MAG: DUF2283 domain-containing protein [Flavobacteriales bacterium]|nr:DUF2283 domain-containing protein [Flavobacteriales bacterium]